MARALVSRDKVNDPDELAAADALWGAVSAGLVRLPLSSAHLLETARAGIKPRRRELATAMLQGHAGWHMRHPVDVRRLELMWGLRGFQGARPSAADIFGVDPALPFRYSERAPFPIDPRLSNAEQHRREYMARRMAWAASLLGDELSIDERATADAAVSSWAQKHEKISGYMRDNPARRDKRLVAAGLILADLEVEIAQAARIAGVSEADMGTVLRHDTVLNFFERLPFIGRVMEVTFQRIRNPQYAWNTHDLNDLMYLACAAGYADLVIIEKDVASTLKDGGSRTTDGAIVLSKLKQFESSAAVLSSP